MARGLRSSRAKTNKSKLRAKTFGPVEDARTERLAKRLAEISDSPVTKNETMDVDADEDTAETQQQHSETTNQDAMNVDVQNIAAKSSKKIKTRKELRKIKRDSKRKPRNLIAFKTKAKNPGARRRRQPRI